MGTQGTDLTDGYFARAVLGAAANAVLDWFEYDTITLADGGEQAISQDGQVRAVGVIFDTSADEVALVSFEGDADDVAILAQSDANFVAAANGTDGQTNLYSSSSTYEINNENGSDVTYEVLLIRVP